MADAEASQEQRSVIERNMAMPARYLPVSSISNFASESELLVAGERVKLQIKEIFNSRSKPNRGHKMEVAVLQNIQKMLLHGVADWTGKQIDTFRDFCNLKKRMSAGDSDLDDFAFSLMDKFLENFKETKVVLRNFREMPPLVRAEFFGADGLTMSSFAKLLPNVTCVALTDLEIVDLIKNSKQYMDCLQNWASSDNADVRKIENIQFRSIWTRDEGRRHTKLTKRVEDHVDLMNNNDCELEYECNVDGYHCIASRRRDVAEVKEENVDRVWTNEIEPKSAVENLEDDAEDVQTNQVESTKADEKEEEEKMAEKKYGLKLDADIKILETFDNEKTLQYAETVVRNSLRAKLGKLWKKVKVKIIGINRGSMEVEYQLIFDDMKEEEEIVEKIENSTTSSDQVQFESMVFPVISHVEKSDLALSEEVMKKEVAERKKKEEEEARQQKLLEAAKEAKRRMEIEERWRYSGRVAAILGISVIRILDVSRQNILSKRRQEGAMAMQTYFRAATERIRCLRRISRMKEAVKVIWMSYRRRQWRDGVQQCLDLKLKQKDGAVTMQTFFRSMVEQSEYQERLSEVKDAVNIIWTSYRRWQWRDGMQMCLDLKVDQRKMRQRNAQRLRERKQILQKRNGSVISKIEEVLARCYTLNGHKYDVDDGFKAICEQNGKFLTHFSLLIQKLCVIGCRDLSFGVLGSNVVDIPISKRN